jgi:multicomponent Na+:H+ antiporter subunit C
LLFVAGGNRGGNEPPLAGAVHPVDPVPQAIMITAIVIGIGVTAVALVMFIHLYHQYGTTSWAKALRRRFEP